jgi:diguanylate cyclase (GGDEF)-like protein
MNNARVFLAESLLVKVFDLISRISKLPTILIDLSGKLEHCNQLAHELLYETSSERVDSDGRLIVDDTDGLSQYLRLCAKNLSLIQSSLTFGDERYKLEGMRYQIEGVEKKLVLITLSLSKQINTNFKQLNEIVDLKYAVTRHKSLEQQLLLQAEELRKSKDEILKLANYDHLTGLISRGFFEQTLKKSISQCDRDGTKLALIYCDLDGFKKINDIFGHYIGDQLLVHIGKCFQNSVRKSDSVSRFGGDEFIILLGGIKDELLISIMINRIESTFTSSIEIESKLISITNSMGVAIYPDDSKSSLDLYKHADLALSEAKLKKGNACCFFSEKLWNKFTRFNLIENELRIAIEKKLLYLHYQPQYDIHSLKMIGVEVLCRWNHKSLGEISPGEFINVAEKTGLISALTVCVFDMALNQYKKWVAEFPKLFENIKLSINISAISLNDQNEFNVLLGLAKKSKITASNICFEVTETAIMSKPDLSVHLLTKSANAGYHNAVDDFGVGSTSLDLLRKLPATILKIDICFIKGICENQSDYLVVKAISRLAKAFGLYVIAEGIEESSQLEKLKELRVDAVQGYYLSKPVPPEVIPDLI